jgi:molybdopterin molybdotransferase
MADAVSTAQALGLLLPHARRQPALRLPLNDSVGHVLTHDVAAPWPLPPWTASSMDGYAVRGADIAGANEAAPVVLPLAGGADAGDAQPPPLPAGSAWRVATGGRVPEGADSVVRVEDTDEVRDTRYEGTAPSSHLVSRISFLSARDAGRNVRPAGGDVAEGSVALTAGTLITPGVLALLAALGESHPMVHRKPRVAILASGDEVVTLDQRDRVASGERIADVNGPMLAALVEGAGGVPVPLGLVPDAPEALAAAMRGAADADLLLSAGGISVGHRDHVPDAMASLDATLLFRRVRVRPGGPTSAALLPDGRLWLALPGNPVSAFVTFHLLARPVIRKMMGDERRATGDNHALPVTRRASHVTARLAASVARDAVLDQYVRVTLSPADDGGPPWARLTGNQGSWVLTSIATADGMARIPAGEGVAAAESAVEVLVTGDWRPSTWHG